MSVQVPTVTLNNGVEMPILGFGVYQVPAEDTEKAVSDRLPPPRYRSRLRRSEERRVGKEC